MIKMELCESQIFCGTISFKNDEQHEEVQEISHGILFNKLQFQTPFPNQQGNRWIEEDIKRIKVEGNLLSDLKSVFALFLSSHYHNHCPFVFYQDRSEDMYSKGVNYFDLMRLLNEQ